MANHSPKLISIQESDILSENATNHDKVLDNKAKKGRATLPKRIARLSVPYLEELLYHRLLAIDNVEARLQVLGIEHATTGEVEDEHRFLCLKSGEIYSICDICSIY